MNSKEFHELAAQSETGDEYMSRMVCAAANFQSDEMENPMEDKGGSGEGNPLAIERFEADTCCSEPYMRPFWNGDYVEYDAHMAVVMAYLDHIAELRSALDLAVSRGCNHCSDSIKKAREIAGQQVRPSKPFPAQR